MFTVNTYPSRQTKGRKLRRTGKLSLARPVVKSKRRKIERTDDAVIEYMQEKMEYKIRTEAYDLTNILEWCQMWEELKNGDIIIRYRTQSTQGYSKLSINFNSTVERQELHAQS